MKKDNKKWFIIIGVVVALFFLSKEGVFFGALVNGDVIFRTDTLTDYTDSEIAVDANGDGTLERWKQSSVSIRQQPAECDVNTPEGYCVQVYSSYITYIYADFDITGSGHNAWRFDGGLGTACSDCTIPTTNTPTEPYTSNGQEVYYGSSSTGPVCGDGVCETGETVTSCSSDCGITTCTNECVASVFECQTPTTYDACGNFDSDPCLEMGYGLSCPSGQTCEDTACSGGSVCGNGLCETGETATSCSSDCDTTPTCTNECSTSGTKTCVGTTGYKTCGNYDADTCLEWSTTTSCSSGYTCSSGACILSTGGTCFVDTNNNGVVDRTELGIAIQSWVNN